MSNNTEKKQECNGYNLIFDLDLENNPCNGSIEIKNDKIKIVIESEKSQFSLKEFSQFLTEKQIGSACFVGILNGEKTILVKTTMGQYEKFAELAKALNYYLKSGKMVDLDYNENICPKCKQPLFNHKQCPYCQSKGKVLMRFIKMFKPFYPLLLASIITTLICQSFWIILPFFQRIAIDDYIRPKNQDITTFFFIVLSMIAIHLIMTIAYKINAKFTNKVSNGIGKELRSMVFKKVQALSMSSISKKTAGELINRINTDTAKIQDFISDFGPEMILRIISFIVLFIIIVLTNWQLAILILVPMPIVFFIVSKLQEKIHIYYLNFWRKSAKANSVLHDILSGIRIVKIFGSENREIKKYRTVSENYTKSQQRAELYWSYRMPFIDFLITIGQYFLLYFGSNLILQGKMQIGELIQLSSYVGMIYIPLRWMMYIRRSITNVGVSATKILEILDADDGVINLDDEKEIIINGDIKFENVYFGYKKYEDVLKNVSFDIKKGEMIGIVGHSGVGKSTLINLILHLYDATDGAILIDG
ncbi:MAG: ABC transporter transmembrane domain-containing protein, partial [Oscillospiraceae bacterium]